MKITFLGTGTSQGVPIITCNCEVCKSVDKKDKRLRTSLFLSEDGKDIVIDAGPDFRQQMLVNKIMNVDAICITHEHKDHVAGLDDIRPFNFSKKKAMDIYAESRVMDSIKQEFPYVFKDVDERYPGVPLMNLHRIDNNEFTIDNIVVQPIRVMHWELPILGYRIKDFVYITDAKTIPEEEFEKLKNVKVLVINALQIMEHYSHFTLKEALQVIERIKPEKAYLTHISHKIGKHSEVNTMLPKNVQLAYDGLTIEV